MYWKQIIAFLPDLLLSSWNCDMWVESLFRRMAETTFLFYRSPWNLGLIKCQWTTSIKMAPALICSWRWSYRFANIDFFSPIRIVQYKLCLKWNFLLIDTNTSDLPLAPIMSSALWWHRSYLSSSFHLYILKAVKVSILNINMVCICFNVYPFRPIQCHPVCYCAIMPAAKSKKINCSKPSLQIYF